ncbi:MAG: CBS domain-containing protein [Spirochaetes bacterium]|nr:CBS domain-containing protein [Spirochaetota bacterium]
MNIIIGHSNMDMDCLGSMILAKYLYPDYMLVRSNLIHPVARNLYNLYQYRFNMISTKDLRNKEIENVVIVDTRSSSRLKEYFEIIKKINGKIEIYDHHPADTFDIDGAILYEDKVGSNTSLIGKFLLQKNIPIEPEDASIALAGIYADTGNFTNENVTELDFQVASYLMKFKPSINLVKIFLKTLKEDYQISLIHELLNSLIYKKVKGQQIIFSLLNLDKQVPGLAAVVEKVFEIEAPDAIFCVFYFNTENESLIIARSNAYSINVKSVMEVFGGSGHKHAASATLKKAKGNEILQKLMKFVFKCNIQSLSASDIMTKDVKYIYSNWTVLQASIFLEKINHTGAPVLDEANNLVGFLTLKDIMKARKINNMHSPVSAYMSKKLITINKNSSLREIENLFYQYDIGHLPVVENINGKIELIGIITRTDYLNIIKEEKKEVQIIEQNIKSIEKLN